MPVVNCAFTVPTGGGGEAPASGYGYWRPTERRDLEGAISVPDHFKVTLDEDGEAAPTVTTTTSDWAWEITWFVNGERWVDYKAVGTPGPVDDDDLTTSTARTLDLLAP